MRLFHLAPFRVAGALRYVNFVDAICTKGVPKGSIDFWERGATAEQKKLFVIPHGKRKAELVVTSDMLLRNTIYFPDGKCEGMLLRSNFI